MTSVKQVRLAQQGDAQAQTALYESMYKRVYYLALRMTRRAEDAEDVTQETFLSAFQALPNLTDSNAFEGWLFQIAANKSRKLLRKNSRLVDLSADEDGRTMLDDLPDEDEALIPTAAVEKDADRQILLDLIESLPEQQRQCVYLFYYGQLSVKQIAEVLECSEGTVKSRLNYARQKLREAVLATEERDGIRLHALAPLGMLLLKDCQLSTAGLTVTALGGAGAATAAGGAAASSTAGTTAAGSAAKTGLLATAKAKVIAGVTAAAITVGGGAAILSQRPQPLTFTDPAMEANIRLLLDRPEGKLYPEDAAELYSIYIFDDGVATDNQWGEPVTAAVDGTQPVTSLADLAQLPELQQLYYQANDPALLNTVGQWPQLHTMIALGQPSCTVSDLSFLEGMPALSYLGIRVAGGVDLTTLEQCDTLQFLDLLSDGSVTLSIDAMPQLRQLSIITNQDGTAPDSLVSVEATAPMPALRMLDLDGGTLADLEFLYNMPALASLSLYSRNIGSLDLSPIGALAQLRCISVIGAYDDVIDLSSLAQCEKLELCLCPNGDYRNPPPQMATDLETGVMQLQQIQQELYDEIFDDQ